MSDYDSYSYSDEKDEPAPIQIAFVGKAQRRPLLNNNSDDSEEDKGEIQQRKKESRRLAKEAAQRESSDSDTDLEPWSEPTPAPEANDALANPEEEYRLWVEREVERIRCEIRVDAQIALDAARTRQQKAMSDAELTKLKAEKTPKKRVHLKFMQKYYHKGAFSIGAESEKAKELLQRDFTAPVGDDQYDKTTLPAEMMVRGDDFMKKGRTKWTHLANEDTTTKEMRMEAKAFGEKEETTIPDVHYRKKDSNKK